MNIFSMKGSILVILSSNVCHQYIYQMYGNELLEPFVTQ